MSLSTIFDAWEGAAAAVTGAGSGVNTAKAEHTRKTEAATAAEGKVTEAETGYTDAKATGRQATDDLIAAVRSTAVKLFATNVAPAAPPPPPPPPPPPGQ